MEVVRKRRIARVSKACENCRKRKIRCSGGPVCNECSKYNEECVVRSEYRKSKRGLQSTTKPAESSYEQRSQIEIPDYLSVSGNKDTEYFGPASNFSFVNQLNRLFQQLDDGSDKNGKGFERFGMKPTVLEHTSSSVDFNLDNITTETMNKLLVAFLETWAIPCPMFTAHQVFTLASSTWHNPLSSANDQALLYLILSVGASTSYFDIEDSNPEAFPVARGFFNLALHTVPTIFSQVSFEAARIIFLMGLSACNLGDTSLSYIYTGLSVRISLAIGLHKNGSVTKTLHSFDEHHHRRFWASVWQFEKYWSLSVGRPSSSIEQLAIPMVNEEDFEYEGYGDLNAFKMTTEHMKIRVQFAFSYSEINSELYSTKNDLLTILSKVEQFSNDIDNLYLNCSDKFIVQESVQDDLTFAEIARIREWFWIRIYYLYLKLMIFRPFLILNVYLKNTTAEVPNSIKQKTKAGSDTCVNLAIDLLNFIVKLNNKVRMIQPILFISTYLESASSALLFYIVSGISNIPDSLAHKIWDGLQDIRNFLNGSYGSYSDAAKILARDGIESLHGLLRKRNNNGTYFDRLMKPVLPLSPLQDGPELPDEDRGLEAFWLQALEWISY